MQENASLTKHKITTLVEQCLCRTAWVDFLVSDHNYTSEINCNTPRFCEIVLWSEHNTSNGEKIPIGTTQKYKAFLLGAIPAISRQKFRNETFH